MRPLASYEPGLPDSDGLSSREVWSSFCGYVTLGCVVSLLPQIWLIWRTKSSRGISIALLTFWFVGDVFSLLGTIVEHLLPTQIYYGSIYGALDGLTILLCVYYRRREASLERREKPSQHSSLPASDTISTLVKREKPDDLAEKGLPSPDAATTTAGNSSSTQTKQQKRHAARKEALLHVVLIVLAMGVAILAWAFVVYRHRSTLQPTGVSAKITAAGWTFGWLGTAAFCLSRPPQLWKNYRSKSCEGLSPWTFGIVMTENSAYAASILLASTSSPYLLANLPYLFQSFWCISLDIILFGQFLCYGIEGTEVGSSSTEPGAATSSPSTNFEQTDTTSSDQSLALPSLPSEAWPSRQSRPTSRSVSNSVRSSSHSSERTLVEEDFVEENEAEGEGGMKKKIRRASSVTPLQRILSADTEQTPEG